LQVQRYNRILNFLAKHDETLNFIDETGFLGFLMGGNCVIFGYFLG
jgi:hypothetical protein